MSWFVVVPAAWFGIALVLGLLIGRCISVDGQPAAQLLGTGSPTPVTTDTPSAGDDSRSADDRDHSLARTV